MCFVLGTEKGADLGPLITPEAKQKVCDLIQSGVDEGASVREEETNKYNFNFFSSWCLMAEMLRLMVAMRKEILWVHPS